MEWIESPHYQHIPTFWLKQMDSFLFHRTCASRISWFALYIVPKIRGNHVHIVGCQVTFCINYTGTTKPSYIWVLRALNDFCNIRQDAHKLLPGNTQLHRCVADAEERRWAPKRCLSKPLFCSELDTRFLGFVSERFWWNLSSKFYPEWMESFPLSTDIVSGLCMAMLKLLWILPLTSIKSRLHTSDFIFKMNSYCLYTTNNAYVYLPFLLAS